MDLELYDIAFIEGFYINIVLEVHLFKSNL